jgi:hypothetical protein
MSQKVITSDIYEAAYYLTLGAVIEKAELIEENKRKICVFTLTGDLLNKAQGEYLNCNALVNLWDFRRSLTRINSLVGSVKANASRILGAGDKKNSLKSQGGNS